MKKKSANKKQIEFLKTLQEIVFGLHESNIELSVQTIMDLFNPNFVDTFNLILCNLIYESFSSQIDQAKTFINFIKLINTKEKKKKKIEKGLFQIFSQFLFDKNSQESYYLIEEMIKNKLIKSKVVEDKPILYFAQYKKIEETERLKISSRFKEEFFNNFDDLRRDNWSLHKKFVSEGINQLEIAKIIRNDEIEKLQEISTKNNFDFNQKIQPSLYERFSFINTMNVSLIDYSAFFASIKCFKYLMLNSSDLTNTCKYAIAGGNIEIFHLCEQKNSSLNEAYETAIKFHRNDIFHYLYEDKKLEVKDLNELGKKCILYNEFNIFSYLEDKGMKLNQMFIHEASKVGNLFLIKYLLKRYKMPKNILLSAVESRNIELLDYIIEKEGNKF